MSFENRTISKEEGDEKEVSPEITKELSELTAQGAEIQRLKSKADQKPELLNSDRIKIAAARIVEIATMLGIAASVRAEGYLVNPEALPLAGAAAAALGVYGIRKLVVKSIEKRAMRQKEATK